MDTAEAKTLLKSHLQSYRSRPYADLVRLIGRVEVARLPGASGVEYQVEINFNWDNRTGGNVRVIGSIDNGGWRAFVPLCEDFIMAPDGTFIGE